MIRRYGGAIIVALLLICVGVAAWNHDGWRKNSAPPQPPLPEIVADVPADPMPECNAGALWKSLSTSGTVEARSAAAVTTISQWPESCRREAFNTECQFRCDDFLSDLLIKAAPAEEARALRGLRLERNRKSLALGRALFGRTEKIVTYALSMVASDRNAPTCVARMVGDFKKIGALLEEVDVRLAELPIGAFGLKQTLTQAKFCLNCANDRELCKDMRDSFEIDKENLAALESLVASDAKELARR